MTRPDLDLDNAKRHRLKQAQNIGDEFFEHYENEVAQLGLLDWHKRQGYTLSDTRHNPTSTTRNGCTFYPDCFACPFICIISGEDCLTESGENYKKTTLKQKRTMLAGKMYQVTHLHKGLEEGLDKALKKALKYYGIKK